MPAKSLEYEIPIALRISREQAATIDTWAARMGLNRASVVRMLIAHARGEDGRLHVNNPAPWCDAAAETAEVRDS
jgi:hypothetical protein